MCRYGLFSVVLFIPGCWLKVWGARPGLLLNCKWRSERLAMNLLWYTNSAASSMSSTVTTVLNSTLSCCKLPAYFEFFSTASCKWILLPSFQSSCFVAFQSKLSAPFNCPLLYSLRLGTACRIERISSPHWLSSKNSHRNQGNKWIFWKAEWVSLVGEKGSQGLSKD